MDNNNSVAKGGVSFCELLGIVFVVLKLCKVITWSWWIVTIPIWAPISLGLFGLLVYLVIILIIKIVNKRKRKI